MPGAFLYADVIRSAASFTTLSAVPAGMPLTNLLHPQPRMRCRLPVPWTDSSGGLAGWDVTTGAGLGFPLQPARTNYLPLSVNPSSGLTNSGDSANRSYAANVAAAPDGTLTAYKVAGVTAGADARVGGYPTVPVSGATVTFSFHAKAAEVSKIFMQAWGTSAAASGAYSPYADFNLANGTFTVSGGTAKMVSAGAGWWRCAITWTLLAASSIASFVYGIRAANLAAAGNGFYIWGPQLEIGALSDYMATAGSVVSRSVTVPWAALRVDLGATVSMDCLALISTTLGAGARLRVRLSATDTTGSAGEAWDTGVQDANTSSACNGNVVLIRAAPAVGRYLLLELYDPAGGAVDIGRLVAGKAWRLTRSHSYGIEEGWLALDRRDRNELTGAEFAVPAIQNPRMARFTLPVLTSAEAKGDHRNLVRQLGAAADALWLPDWSLLPAERNLRALFGGVNQPGQAATLSQQALGVYSRAFTITERL